MKTKHKLNDVIARLELVEAVLGIPFHTTRGMIVANDTFQKAIDIREEFLKTEEESIGESNAKFIGKNFGEPIKLEFKK
jgi:hypothetical protein